MDQPVLPPGLSVYSELFRYESTYVFGDGREKWSACSSSAMYVHFGRREVFERVVRELVGDRKSSAWIRGHCLDAAHHLEDCNERWICLYIGEVATSPTSKRFGKDRLRHEFALAGYFQQAPALEAICSLLYTSHEWTPIAKQMGNGKWRTDLSDTEEKLFFAWCKQNIRYAWVPIEVDRAKAKQKLAEDENLLIQICKPLLNVKHSVNGLARFVTEARQRFREHGTLEFKHSD